MDSKTVPEYVLHTFYDGACFENHLLYGLDKISLNNPESNWQSIVGINTNPEFKIRPSLTTSEEGLKRLNMRK